MDKGADVFIGQANFIPGACLLCAAIFHSVSDGMADVTIFKVWADNCQELGTSNTGAQKEDVLVLPSNAADRGLLEGLWEKDRKHKPYTEMDTSKNWGIIGLESPTAASDLPSKEKDSLDTNSGKGLKKSKRIKQGLRRTRDKMLLKVLFKIKGEEQAIRHILSSTQTELKSRLFYVSPTKFADLKRECAKEGKLVSGNDAVCALLWRCLMRARMAAASGEDSEQDHQGDSRLEMTLDGRPYLSLPPTYLGNVVLISRANLPCPILTSPATTLASVAGTLRETADAVDPSTALDAYSLARSLKGYDRFDKRSNPVAGARMLITSLLTMPAANMGFGDRGIFENGGRAEAIRPLMGAFNKYFRICFVMPPRSFGGVEIVFNLSDQEMEYLLQDEEFEKYAMNV
ncbi:hypothetical protein BX600DRAFT_469538, partial [Xylariales sp. PMI_506]